MLAGCSSDSTTEASAVETATENTGVVAYVQKNMDEDDVGKHQAAVTLTGNEDTDKAYAIKQYKNGKFTFASDTVNMNDVDALRKAVNWNQSAGTSYIVTVAKAGYDDEDLGEFILDAMKKNADVATTSNNRFIFSSISVFDAEVSVTATTTATIDGTTVKDGTTEYWVIVFTTAAKPATADTYSGYVA